MGFVELSLDHRTPRRQRVLGCNNPDQWRQILDFAAKYANEDGSAKLP